MLTGIEILMIICNALLAGCWEGCTAVVETDLEFKVITPAEADAAFEECVTEYCPEGTTGCFAVFPGANPFAAGDEDEGG